MPTFLPEPTTGRQPNSSVQPTYPLSQAQEERARRSVEQVLRAEPEDFGCSGRSGRTGWTLPMLVDCLQHRFGIRMSRQAVRRMLAAMGYSWQHRRFMREDATTLRPN